MKASKPEITFHRAQIGSRHYKDCIDIRESVFVKEQNVPFNLEIEYEEESVHYLGLANKTPVCTGRLRLVGNKVKFERIATLKPYRGKGFAKRLMQHLAQECATQFPGKTMVMNSQVSALSFYESLGWKKLTNEAFYEAGIEHFTLHYPL